MRRAWWVYILLSVTSLIAITTPLPAQDAMLARGMELETAGNDREAAAVYRSALQADDPTSALLGLERVYASLGWTDSLLPVLDPIVARHPDNALIRVVQLRALLMVGKEADAYGHFRAWAERKVGDATPYREYSRLLLENGRFMAADSVLRRGVEALGSERDLAPELAQLRARTGLWELSARSWRDALSDAPYLWRAALFSLQLVPEADRAPVRAALLGSAPGREARQTMARLELAWGDAAAGWRLLAPLAADDSTVGEWLSFADEAEAVGASTVVADALAAVAGASPRPDYLARAAEAALAVGRTEVALELTAGVDDEGASGAEEVRSRLLALRVRALSIAGRVRDAEQLAVDAMESDPALGATLQRELAWAWVRSGDLERARAALERAGADPDDEIHGWIEFYEGDLQGARERLRVTPGAPNDAVTVLALLGRTRSDSAPLIGAAFLTLARGDSAAAVGALTRAAVGAPDVAPMLLMLAGRVAAEAGDDSAAVSVWSTLSSSHPTAPEAAEAELAWARMLLARGDSVTASELLERLIIQHPGSALLPQARRELDAIPTSARRPAGPTGPTGRPGGDSTFTGVGS